MMTRPNQVETAVVITLASLLCSVGHEAFLGKCLLHWVQSRGCNSQSTLIPRSYLTEGNRHEARPGFLLYVFVWVFLP